MVPCQSKNSVIDFWNFFGDGAGGIISLILLRCRSWHFCVIVGFACPIYLSSNDTGVSSDRSVCWIKVTSALVTSGTFRGNKVICRWYHANLVDPHQCTDVTYQCTDMLYRYTESISVHRFYKAMYWYFSQNSDYFQCTDIYRYLHISTPMW